jgi:hypothetical protein
VLPKDGGLRVGYLDQREREYLFLKRTAHLAAPISLFRSAYSPRDLFPLSSSQSYQIKDYRLKPIKLEESFEVFKEALQVLVRAGYLLSSHGLYQINPLKYRFSKTKRGLRMFLEQAREILEKVEEKDWLALIGLIIIRYRFPFLKTHELQVALDRIFGIKRGYREIEGLSASLKEILSLFRGKTLPQVHLLFLRRAMMGA